MHGTPEDAFALCRTYTADHMHIVGAGLEKRDVEDAEREAVQKSLLLLLPQTVAPKLKDAATTNAVPPTAPIAVVEVQFSPTSATPYHQLPSHRSVYRKTH